MVPPKVFVSYSHDDDDHREWVLRLAKRLRKDGVDVILDRWALAPGDQLPLFMERAIRENDFILVICTSRYKERSDGRKGGVGYEGDIMSAEALVFGNRRKFIPILRQGPWNASAPTWLLGSVYVDLSSQSEVNYGDLVRALHSVPPEIPAVGINWQIEASRAAKYLYNHHFEAHRGAILWYSNVTAIFGNDGYSKSAEDTSGGSERAQREVATVRKELSVLGVEELAFGLNDTCYTWVLLVRTEKVVPMDKLVWASYPAGASNNEHQKNEAHTRIWTYLQKPFNDQSISFS